MKLENKILCVGLFNIHKVLIYFNFNIFCN